MSNSDILLNILVASISVWFVLSPLGAGKLFIRKDVKE
jgi:hypothetical protein